MAIARIATISAATAMKAVQNEMLAPLLRVRALNSAVRQDHKQWAQYFRPYISNCLGFFSLAKCRRAKLMREPANIGEQEL